MGKKSSSKGKGFKQPIRPHEHWHVDISYLNIRGTFFYLTSVLDGFSRAIVHHEIRTSMTQGDIQIVLERAGERFPEARPRIISDNGPQFIARDFKAYVRERGMDHVKTSPYYPESNGKIERYHRTLKTECIRPKTPLSLEDAQRVVAEFVDYYNEVRLHSAIGYITPMDRLNGRDAAIFDARDQKLEAARERRAIARRATPIQPRSQNGKLHFTLNPSRIRRIPMRIGRIYTFEITKVLPPQDLFGTVIKMRRPDDGAVRPLISDQLI